MSVVLETKGLSKSFGGIVAVDDVSFQLQKGELLALIGPNGAGKSTCFNMLMGQLPPTAGVITSFILSVFPLNSFILKCVLYFPVSRPKMTKFLYFSCIFHL